MKALNDREVETEEERAIKADQETVEVEVEGLNEIIGAQEVVAQGEEGDN